MYTDVHFTNVMKHELCYKNLEELLLLITNNTSVLGPEEVRLVSPQLLVGVNLSRRHGQVGARGLDPVLVGHVLDTVLVAVVADKLIVPLLL